MSTLPALTQPLSASIAANSITVSTYIGILVSLFFALPLAILLVRYGGWTEALSLRVCARRVPLQRLQALVLHDGSLSKRPLSQQLEAYLFAQTSWGYVLDVTQAVLSLISVSLFIAASYRPPSEPEPTWAMALELVLTLYFLVDYGARFYMSKDRLSYYFSLSSLLDYITIIPGLVSIAISDSAFDSQAWVVARTLRVFRIFRVVRMMRVVSLSPGSSLQRQIAFLVVTVLAMVFCAAGIYQIVESTPDDFVPFHRAMLYMTIIVIGRPPVPTKTDAAVIMVTITIMIAASVIPVFVAELARLFFESQGREAYASDPATPHVVIVGDINSSRVKALLGQFFHKSRDGELLCPVVILSEHKYEGALRAIVEQQRYGGSVTYVRGVARRPADLARAGVANASTVIVLASRSGVNVDTAIEADAEVVSICLAIKSVNKRVRILAQLRRPRSRDHLLCLPGWRDHDRAVAIASLSMTLMGVGALVPGLPTLLTNLIHQGNKGNARSSNPRRRRFMAKNAGLLASWAARGRRGATAGGSRFNCALPGWANKLVELGEDVTAVLWSATSIDEDTPATAEEALAALGRPLTPVDEYASGFAQDMFAFAVTPGLAGRTFAAAARLAYLRYGVLLIGVRMRLGGSSASHGDAVAAAAAGAGGAAKTSTAAAAAAAFDETGFSVTLFPSELVLTPGMYAHAIAFDAIDVATLLQGTGGGA